jgi:Fe-S cluster assembly scaffold protein SufB
MASWRDELLSRVWQGLSEIEKTTGKAYDTVLRVRVDHPEARSPRAGRSRRAAAGQTHDRGAVRVLLHRAREQFGELLLDEVAQSLTSPTIDALEQELIDLDLWQYCRDQLQSRRQ